MKEHPLKRKIQLFLVKFPYFAVNSWHFIHPI